MQAGVLALVLLLYAAKVQAYDGCDNSGFVMCGDKCAGYCYCGNKTISFAPPHNNYDEYYCCGDNLTCQKSGYDTAECPEGEALPLTQQCSGKCHYIEDRTNYYRNTVNYNNTDKQQCVRVRDKCLLRVS